MSTTTTAAGLWKRDDATHTAHRQLSDVVSNNLAAEINAMSRSWAEETSPLERARAAATIFRVLFAGSTAEAGAHERWQQLAAADQRARRLTEGATGLTERLAATSGYQTWSWDFAPPGRPFDRRFHEPWQNSPPEGRVGLVVIPAYLVDGTVLSKPFVYTE